MFWGGSVVIASACLLGGGEPGKNWQRCLIPGRHTHTTAPLGREQPKKRSMCSYKAIEKDFFAIEKDFFEQPKKRSMCSYKAIKKDLPLLGRRQRRHCQRLLAGGGDQAKIGNGV